MVHIELNEKDQDMVNVFTIQKDGTYILWAVCHKDILGDLDLSDDALDGDFEHIRLIPKVVTP